MKQILALGFVLCAASSGFAQSRPQAIKDRINDPKSREMSAKADTMLIDKKAIADDPQRNKKPRRDRSHKECSRMKS